MLSTAILGNIPNIEKKCHVKVTPVIPRHSRKTIEMDISPHVFHMFINFSRLLVCDLEHLGMWTSPAFPSQNHEKTVPRIHTNPLKRTVIYPNSTLKYCNIYIYLCCTLYVYYISIAKSTKFNLQSKHLQISLVRMTGPEFVDALKALNATWSEAIALLSGPATASGVSPAWAKAAEARRVHGYFLVQFPVKDRINMGYIYILW